MYLSAQKFALEVGLSYCYVRSLCRQGKLPHLMAGRKMMINVEDGREVLRRMAEQVPQAPAQPRPKRKKFTMADFKEGLEQLRAGC